MIIIISGMMGTGKSTYTAWLAQQYGFIPQFETVIGNPYLEKFYAEPQRYAKALQDFFLNDRINALQKALQQEHTILDRSLLDNEIFNRVYHQMGYMTDDEFADCQHALSEAKHTWLSHHSDDTLLIYLQGDFETVLQRITGRAHAYEQCTENSHHLTYYRQLYQAYQTWFDDYDFSPKIAIDIQRFDVVKRPEEVVQYIKETLMQTSKGETTWLQQL